MSSLRPLAKSQAVTPLMTMPIAGDDHHRPARDRLGIDEAPTASQAIAPDRDQQEHGVEQRREDRARRAGRR